MEITWEPGDYVMVMSSIGRSPGVWDNNMHAHNMDGAISSLYDSVITQC